MKLVGVKVRGFRAFSRELEFELAQTNIFGGPNGTGKTSFFDAVQWCLFGSVPRLSGTRDFVRAGNVYQNLFENSSAYVALQFLDNSGDRVRRERTVNSCRTFWGKEEVSEERFAGFLSAEGVLSQNIFLHNNLLQQEAVNEFVRDLNPRERYDAMLSLVRDDSSEVLLQRIEAAASTMDSTVQRAERDRDTLGRRIVDLERDVLALRQAGGNLSFDSLATRYQELLARTGSFAKSIVNINEESPKEVSALGIQAKSLSENSRKLVNQVRNETAQVTKIAPLIKEGLDLLQESEIRQQIETIAQSIRHTEESLAANNKDVDQRSLELSDVGRQLQLEEKSSETTRRLLAEIRSVVADDVCPVCERPIERQTLMEIIGKRIGTAGQQLSEAFRKRDSAQAGLTEAQLRRESLEAELEKQRADLARVQDRLNKRAYAVSVLDRVRQSATLERLGLILGDDLLKFDEAVLQVIDNLEEMSREAGTLATDVENLKSQTLVPKKEQELEAARNANQQASANLAKLQKTSSILTRIKNVVLDARAETVKQVLDSYKPLIRDLYYRFEPHPVFSEIDFEVYKAFKDTELYFVVFPKKQSPKAYPSTVFSTSQLNALAVCIFLALNLKSTKSIPWLMMDDPIQAMDDLNVLGFCEVLRQAKRERQLFISTHSEQLFQLLLNKLRPMSQGDEVKGFWFEGWSESGPSISETVVEYRPASYDLRFVREAVGKRRKAS